MHPGPTAVMSLREKLARVGACRPAGLEECLRLIEAVFDSVVANETLSELYDYCTELLSSSNVSQAMTAAAAALVFLSSGKFSELVLRQYAQNVFLPLAVAFDGQPTSTQLLRQLTSVLVLSQAWDVAGDILQCAHNALAAPSSCSDRKPILGADYSTAKYHQQQQLSALKPITVSLPANTACVAVKEVTAAVSHHVIHYRQDYPEQQLHRTVQDILQFSTGQLFRCSCNLLVSPDPALRQAAFQLLLPALLHVADSSSSSSYNALLHQLWLQCLQMVSGGVLSRRMGLSVLLQYWSAWPVQPPNVANAGDHRTTQTAEAEAYSSSDVFWSLLRDCLVDNEALNRKRALRLLQLLLPEPLLQLQPVWGVFLALYELLDEFSPHLVKASWPMISQVHPVAPEFMSHDAETDVAISGQINLLKISSADQQQQQQGPGDCVPLAFCWSRVLWTRGLQHKNLQVQRMCMKTLLKRHWTRDILSQVHPSFITAVLLPALLSPVHHRTQTAGGLTATGGVVDATSQQQQPQQLTAVATAHPLGPGSSSRTSFDVVREAAGLLSRYVSSVGAAGAAAVLSGGLRLLSTPGTDLPRSGLLAVLRALAAVATTAVGEGMVMKDMTESEAAAAAKEALSMLQALSGRLATYAGQRFRINCYNLLLTIAAAAAPASSCNLSTVARLLQGMPAWMLYPGGPLQQKVSAWLLTSSSDTVSGIKTMWQQYFNSSSSSSSTDPNSPDLHQEWHAEAKDYVAWRSLCDAWLRIVMCCEQFQQQLTAAASELVDRVGQLLSRSYLPPGTPEKTLIMLTGLLEAAETAGRVAAEAGQQLSAQTQIALQAASAVAEPLSACVSSYCCCYRATSAGRSSNGHYAEGESSCRAWAAAERAQTAVQAASTAVVLLARTAAHNWSTSSSSGAALQGAAAASSKHIKLSLLLLIRKLCEVGEQLSGEPLARVPAAPHGDWQAAAAAEQLRASALKVLCQAALAMCRALVCCPGLCPTSLQLTPANWVTAVLRETDAARAARADWLAAAGRGSSSSSTRSQPLSGWIEDMGWKCLDAVMMLTAMTHNTHQSRAANMAAYSSAPAADTVSSALSTAGDPFLLPPGVLCTTAATDVFVQGLEALQWTASDHGSDLVELLRCMRRVWCLMVKDKQLQVSAQQALEATGVLVSTEDDDSSNSSSTPLCKLASALGNSLLGVLQSSKKRPQLMYSLVISTLLLPELCVLRSAVPPELAALHTTPDAPIRRFIQGLIHQGSKGSPRLMLALGLQLGGYLSDSPQLLVWYAAELRQLWMFGVAAQVGAEELTLALPNVEESLERQLLRDPLDPELQEAYALTDIGPRVAMCCGLYQLAVQAGLVQQLSDRSLQHCSNTSSGCSETWVCGVEAAGVQLWGHWLQSTLTDPALCGERFKVGSDIHRLKVRAWQGLAVAANFISSTRQRDLAAAAVEALLAQLGVNNPPSIKQYQEAIVAHLLLQHTGLLEELLLPQFASVEKGSTATGSHILVAVQVALHSQPEVQRHVLPLLVKQLLPWTNHHTHNIRTFAQLGFCAIMDSKPLDVWEGWLQGLGPGGIEVLGNLLRFMHDNTDFQRFRRAMGTGILGWSPVGVTSPRRIFSSSLHLAGAEETPVTFEGVPETMMDKLITFLAAERAKLREAAVERVAGYEGGALPAADDSRGTLGAAASDHAAGTPGAAGMVVDFQRKVTPHERAALMADVLDAWDAADAVGSGPAGSQRHELIVVASLISKVPNLGGLARTAEVLGAGALVLGDKRVATEAGFTSVSVTAERWVPLIEVTEAALIPWLAKQKADGYTLVGLEQTAESTSLPNYRFPSRSVLVLGREKEGIPPEIIAMLDATVEIPQLGVIRSLNVHVSGAIAMYEYAKQKLQ